MRYLSFLTLFLACSPALAGAEPGDVVADVIGYFDAGIICSPEPLSTLPAPDTLAGTVNIIEGIPPFVSTSRIVPGLVGVGFGVVRSVISPDPFEVTVIVRHPPMGADGVIEQSYSTLIGQDPGVSLYDFEYPHEIVPGAWSIAATDGEQLLFEAHFTVVPPAKVPELAAICGYEALLS